LLLAAPDELDTTMRQLRRKQAHALIIPTHSHRIILSDTPVTGRGGERRSCCLRGHLRGIVARMAAEAWVRDPAHRLTSIPRGWRAELARPEWEHPEEDTDQDALPLIDLGSLNRPAEFLRDLGQAGVHCRQPGRAAEIHVQWCDDRFQGLLREHKWRRPDSDGQLFVIPRELMHGHEKWERAEGRRILI
jgi:hypothetical protein